MCNCISATIQRANLNPMDRARMDDMVCKLVDYLGACERIFRSPIPLVYTRHTARFLTGIEELGIQIEEPFGILPLEALCDTSIEAVVMDMQESYKKGYFGQLGVQHDIGTGYNLPEGQTGDMKS